MTALVTGGNGHLGSTIVRMLSASGRPVRASVLSRTAEPGVAEIAALPGVEVVEANVLDSMSLERAFDGVETVFHTAAIYAYVLKPGDAERLIRTSVEGAANAVRAAAKQGARKVVMTSSVVTLPPKRRGEVPATEDEWASDLTVPYFRAKVEAERAAHALARDMKLDLVTILPGSIGGPGFFRNTPTIDIIEGISKGSMKMAAPDQNLPYVDVRDAARAHILAAQKPSRGRYIAANDVFPTFMELTRLLHGIDPSIPVAPRLAPEAMIPLARFFDWLGNRTMGTPRVVAPELLRTMKGKVWAASSARSAHDLGWRPEVSIEQSLADTLRQIAANRRAR
jgi:dihydroflavonol-4-reductase